MKKVQVPTDAWNTLMTCGPDLAGITAIYNREAHSAGEALKVAHDNILAR